MSQRATRVQTSVLVDVKDRAEREAKAQGFGNLQDAVRLFIHQLAQGKVVAAGFDSRYEFVSPQMLHDYTAAERQLEEDLATGKAKAYDDIDEMFKDLDAA